MKERNLFFGIALMLLVAIFFLVGCQQPGETGSDGQAVTIEVWDSSTPPKFLGYNTGLYDRSVPLIITSKGYCVQLNNINSRGIKSFYGFLPAASQSIGSDQWEEIKNNTGYGYAIFFATSSNPTNSDTPYASWHNYNIFSSYIINSVVFNPNNGGTYYTWDNNKALQEITILGNYLFYDNLGTIRTWNDDYEYFGEPGLQVPSSSNIGEKVYFTPLKKIGGYAELGLPDPSTVKQPLVYKVVM